MRYKLVQNLNNNSTIYTKECDSIEDALETIAKDKNKKKIFYLYDETDTNNSFLITNVS